MKCKHLFVGIIISILLASSLACQLVTQFLYEEPQYIPSPSAPEAPLIPASPPETGSPPAEIIDSVACPSQMEKILKQATSYRSSETKTIEEINEQHLVIYTVSGDKLSDPQFEKVPSKLVRYQEDTITQQIIWDIFTALIPLQQRDQVLAEYSIMTDGRDNSLAAVTQTTYDPNLWALEVDIVDSFDTLNLAYTLIHEFAHLLTLGPDQVTPSVAIFNNPENDNIYYDEVAACPVYFPGEGCSHADSYINTFYNKFWADIYMEWQDINLIEDDNDYYNALDDFYYKYRDRFVTEYAATNPEEDIAEAFSFFVLSARPSGDTIAEQKTLFFYNYPELVQLRDQILSGVCKLTP